MPTFKLILSSLLIVALASAADWTTVNPIISSDPAPALIEETTDIRVRVIFTDDSTPTPNTFERDFIVSGSGAFDNLRRQVHNLQLALNELDVFTAAIGPIVPLPPTQLEQAIVSASEARAKLRNLNAYQAESGKASTATLGTSAITITQAKNSLIADIEEDLTNAARLAIFLEQTR